MLLSGYSRLLSCYSRGFQVTLDDNREERCYRKTIGLSKIIEFCVSLDESKIIETYRR